jgi:Trk K+ transport system NAD-binding subunit
VSLVIRRGGLVTPAADTALEAGDEVLVLVDPDGGSDVTELFTRRGV